MKMKKERFLVLTGLLLVLCAGCSNGTTEPEKFPTETAAITQTPMPTNEAEKTPTPTAVQTPVPTAEATATPQPTKKPVEVKAPFAMVSPVPQSNIAEIAGTMTADTYPVVDGSTATLPLSEAVFMLATGEDADVAAEKVVHTKTTNSYKRLYNGEVELLIVYEPSEAIVERMKTEPLLIKPIGLDALVFLTNTANPLDTLTTEQLVDIYSGKITNWAEVGGPNKELLAFQRPSGSGSQTLMQKLVMKEKELVSGDNVFRYSTMSDILEGMLSYNNEDNTLGYSVFYYANNMYYEKDLKLLGVDGVVPSTQTIYDGSYSLNNAFYAVIRTDTPEDSNARKIFDWLTGEEGQQMVLDLGYVPVIMPEGAEVSHTEAKPKEPIELLTKEPLEEGQYFVFFNPQNTTFDFYYGDMTVYNHNWEEVARFYNVTLNHMVYGVLSTRYLPIGQIRQNADGEQKAYYGIYDLEKKAYSVAPSYSNLEVLDVERGYYVIAQDADDWQTGIVINAAGEVLLEDIQIMDWLTINRLGNGYLEMRYDYNNWDNGCTYYFYDENLKLKHVYCEQMGSMPDDAERLAGVDYILMENDGCLINEDGEVVLNRTVFLNKFGDGKDMECKTQIYTVTLAEENKLYPVLYQNKVYLLDINLNLLRIIDNPVMVNDFTSTDYSETFCYYRDELSGNWVYGAYEGETLIMGDGVTPEYIEKGWGEKGYLMCRTFGTTLFLEEHTKDGELSRFTVELREDMQKLLISYSDTGYVTVSQNCGEEMQNPYSMEESMIPVYEKSIYYQGKQVYTGKGMDFDYIVALDETAALWSSQTGNKMILENESVYDEYENSYMLSDFCLFEKDRTLYEAENIYLLVECNETLFFIKGNYVYAVGYDGTEYIRALHSMMSTD